VEVVEEIAATAVVVGDKVDVVGEAEVVGVSPRQEMGTGKRRNLLCFHETIINTITIPGFATMVFLPILDGRDVFWPLFCY